MELFTDDDIEFLRANFSEAHAKAAHWFGDGMPGMGHARPPKDLSDPDVERASAAATRATADATAAANRAGAQATGMSDPDEFHATLLDAMFIISVRREAAERHNPPFFDDAMRWRNASDAEKPRIQDEMTARYSS